MNRIGIILLCIKPYDLNDFILENKEKIHSDVLICSSLAGVSVKTFESEFENKIIEKCKSDKPEIIDSIQSSGKLEDDKEKMLVKVIVQFKENFKS